MSPQEICGATINVPDTDIAKVLGLIMPYFFELICPKLPQPKWYHLPDIPTLTLFTAPWFFRYQLSAL